MGEQVQYDPLDIGVMANQVTEEALNISTPNAHAFLTDWQVAKYGAVGAVAEPADPDARAYRWIALRATSCGRPPRVLTPCS
jgi:hypothetical protein